MNQESSNCQVKQDDFYKVMDELDNYDRHTNKINIMYSEAMLSLASIQFHSSLNEKSFKPTPALTTFNLDTISLQHNQPYFFRRVEQQSYQFEEQTNIQKQVKQLKSCQNYPSIICQRFGVMNNHSQITRTVERFQQVLKLILELIPLQNKVNDEILKVQNDNKQK